MSTHFWFNATPLGGRSPWGITRPGIQDTAASPPVVVWDPLVVVAAKVAATGITTGFAIADKVGKI
jgi:hypothetical protein